MPPRTMSQPIHQSYTLQHLPPPGPIVLSARQFVIQHATDPATAPPPSIPPLFLSALKIREEVFIHGQTCDPSLEIDADDPISQHWVLFASPSSSSRSTEIHAPAATIRLIPPHPKQASPHNDPATSVHLTSASEPDYDGSELWDGKEPFFKIGRLSTVKECRGRGYGKWLVEEAIRWAAENGSGFVGKENLGVEGEWKGLIGANAQKNLQGWYESLGFVVDKGMGIWWEEGIEHVGIWKRVNVTG